MASNPDLVQYIADQCAATGEITVRKMFGYHGIYCDGLIFGLICDNCLYLKPTEAARALLRNVEMRPPYDGAKDYFFIDNVDDRDYLSALVRETCKALPKKKPKKKKKQLKQICITQHFEWVYHPHVIVGAIGAEKSISVIIECIRKVIVLELERRETKLFKINHGKRWCITRSDSLGWCCRLLRYQGTLLLPRFLSPTESIH